jgi:hypothetical protein
VGLGTGIGLWRLKVVLTEGSEPGISGIYILSWVCFGDVFPLNNPCA